MLSLNVILMQVLNTRCGIKNRGIKPSIITDNLKEIAVKFSLHVMTV